jgi:hypothetical protein
MGPKVPSTYNPDGIDVRVMTKIQFPPPDAVDAVRNRVRRAQLRSGRAIGSDNGQRASVRSAARAPRGEKRGVRVNAHVALPQGALVLPVSTPYDIEQLFQHSTYYAVRYGRIRVRLGRREWIVSVVSDQADECAECGKPPERLSFARRLRTLCVPCARREAGLTYLFDAGAAR